MMESKGGKTTPRPHLGVLLCGLALVGEPWADEKGLVETWLVETWAPVF